MNIEKANWYTDGESVRITMPLQKVDEEKRIVSGFATLNNIDMHDDIVLSSASARAFEEFRGNIRLMHQPIPAGKLVNFREEEYYDPSTQKFYQGIYVDVYVSKGAPEVWEMVKDGTLTGFSIGGSVTETESQFVKDAGKVIRFIKAYDLIELSLVDSPANQLSNIFSIQKTADGQVVKGMIADVIAENVFYCAKDEIAFTSRDESKACNVCGADMKSIGWFESDGGDKTDKVNTIVADFTKATETVEGRENDMPEETPEVEAEVEAPEVVTEEVVAEAEAEEATEETPEVEEVEPTIDFTKMFADLSDSVRQALEANSQATTDAIAKVNDQLAEIEAVSTKLDELGAKHAELAEKFAAIDTQLDNVEKRFDELNKSVSGKKSGDLGGSTGDSKLEKGAESKWGGRFYRSVDSL